MTVLFSYLGVAYEKWNIAKESGYYDVVAHGSPEIVEFFGNRINHNTLATILRGREDYKGESIRLYIWSLRRNVGLSPRQAV